MPFRPFYELHQIFSGAGTERSGLIGWLQLQYHDLHDWLGPDLQAVAGTINWREFLKAAALAISSGSVTAAVQVMVGAAGLVVTDPTVAQNLSTWVSAATMLLDLYRRLNQQKPPTGAPKP